MTGRSRNGTSKPTGFGFDGPFSGEQPGQWSFTIGAGLSGSNVVGQSSCSIADDECISVVQRAGYIVRGDVEGSLERWWLNGFALRVFGGYGRALNPGALKCVSGLPSCPPVSASAPYEGAGIGYAF